MHDRDLLGRAAGYDVSREKVERLVAYEALVRDWTRRINLVALSTLPNLWARHIVDSAQLFHLAPHFRHWVDLGSGAGFPGLVIAILASGREGAGSVTLIESDARKAAFLSTVRRTLDIPVEVKPVRSEDVPPLSADVVSARALASLPRLLPMVHRHLNPVGMALLPKGRTANAEVAEARGVCTFDVTEFPSITDPEARILKIERLALA